MTPSEAALACVEAFTERFNACDPAGMDATLHFPHLILADEHLVIWKTPGQVSQAYFDEIIAGGWARSTYHAKQVVLASAKKVHLLVAYSRDRADGTQISRHQNLWIVTLQDGRWGLKQRSY
jgi:hypothetical protein